MLCDRETDNQTETEGEALFSSVSIMYMNGFIPNDLPIFLWTFYV